MSAFACGNLCFMRCACLQTLLGCMRGMYILFIDMLVILSRHVNVYYLWFDVRFMVLSVMFLFLRFCCVLILFGFIMVHPIVLFFIVSFECVLCIMYYLLYMIRLEVFVLWDREWMMPLRFIRSTNAVLFLLFYTYFPFIIGVLFVGMSAPLFEGFG